MKSHATFDADQAVSESAAKDLLPYRWSARRGGCEGNSRMRLRISWKDLTQKNADWGSLKLSRGIHWNESAEHAWRYVS